MGLDWLDILFRLEREFGIKLHRELTEGMLRDRNGSGRYAVTSGEIHKLVLAACNEQNKPIPFSAWHRVKKCIALSCRAELRSVSKAATLKEIGAS